ncbi:hypothetical protein EMPS_02214 [Entomortierella parvispora]|uniref:DUF676 domain-containing protein n=1 Tax=Entomortierella parvispora TaxID=205924 RepID=A0A9P3LTQ3_9FUNG|nr:hypothetical protein EMPS_02214 [Entomortierella parvispora]
MTLAPILAIHHKASLSVGGIVRYRIKILPSQVGSIESLQFRIHNSAPIYRNIAVSSGPWKLSVSLVRNPDKTPSVPELVPSIGCAQVCRLDAKVDKDSTDEGSNEWELEVLSEMILQHNRIDFKVEVFAVPCAGAEAPTTVSATAIEQENNSSGGTDGEVQPQVLQPQLVTCQYKDTMRICGPKEKDGDNLHLVLLTHGIHGSWLDLLYMKEQIDAHTGPDSKTVTFLTDTNHAGTEEGIQMAGHRVAQDILEFTGFCDTEQGKHLRRQSSSKSQGNTKTNGPSATDSLTTRTTSSGSTTENRKSSGVFPRGFTKVSIIGHSLGGLINIYALGYIEEVTKGEFFKTIQPVHFITMASPLLGIGFEHPWVLGYALSLGCIGQTGKDLALQDRSKLVGRSPSSSSSSSSSSTTTAAHASNGANTTPTTRSRTTQDCELDKGPEPLLLAMARPGSVSNKALHRFADRTSYANIENDMAVRFNTSSMMGIPSFDLDTFFAPEGPATAPRKNLYSSALTSTMALLFPKVPAKAKFLSVQDAPSPVVIVSHVDAAPTVSEDVAVPGTTPTKSEKPVRRSSSKSSKRSSQSTQSGQSSHSASSSSSSALSKKIHTLSRADLAQLVADGYHHEMDWTKIGVFIESEAHVQIIVRRKWYNLDGWKCIQDLVERFDFS